MSTLRFFHLRRLLRLAAGLGCALLVTAVAAQTVPAAPAPAEELESLQVADPYLELHTGAGRGYPVFHVAARGDWVQLLMRHTDWTLVRVAGGREGWVHRRQLERTLTASGAGKTFRDVVVDDYLARRLELGAAWGRFKGEPMLKVWSSYRLSDTLSTELAVGQVQGAFSGSNLWHLGLQAEPWSDQRWSPVLGIGLGGLRNIPNASLVSARETRSQLAHATLGLRWYASERLVLRTDYSLYTAFVADTRSQEFRAFTAGLSFFF